jgi:diacylglycerol kinase (ATP)
MSETTVILNPIAGRGAGARLAPQIAAWLREDGLDFDLETTMAPAHGMSLAREAAARGRRLVVAVGGDGTANEVLNGLMQATRNADGTAMAILPTGTGNDFAFSSGIPLDLRQACRIAARGQTQLLDVGRVHADNEEDRYFGNGVGIGFDAIVTMESRKLKRLRGFLVYLVAVVKTIALYYNAPLTKVHFDGGEIVRPSMMISIMNGYRLGGGFHVAPGSRMDDGLFDLCLTGKVNRLQMIALVPRFMRGTHVTDPHISMRQTRQVSVVCESPWVSHVDGEIYGLGARRFEIELLPQRLCLVS